MFYLEKNYFKPKTERVYTYDKKKNSKPQVNSALCVVNKAFDSSTLLPSSTLTRQDKQCNRYQFVNLRNHATC